MGGWRCPHQPWDPHRTPTPPACSLLSGGFVLLGPRAQVSLGRLGVRLETLSRRRDNPGSAPEKPASEARAEGPREEGAACSSLQLYLLQN